MAILNKIVGGAVAAALLATSTTIVSAQQTAADGEAIIYDAQMIADLGGAERINFSGKLRMLSQRIPAAACNLHADVAPELSKEVLVAATEEFERIVNALEHGDAELGIYGAEQRRKSMAALEDLKFEWEPIDAALHLILDEGSSDTLVQQLADQNGSLLDATKKLASELAGQYSDPVSLVQADALRIDIAGRQRMLSQRMSKDFCFASSDIDKDASLEDLKTVTQMFDVSLGALKNGMPEAGIQASTNPDIIAALDMVSADWDLVKTDFQVLKTGGFNDLEVRKAVFEHLNTLLADMNKAVILFSTISKQQI